MVPAEIIELIENEQTRQLGNFVPDTTAYIEKLQTRAELIIHYAERKIGGFCFFYCNDAGKVSSYISLIMVAPEFRGAGIGAALVSYVIEISRVRKFKACTLEVRVDNAPATHLYASLGFESIEQRGVKMLMKRSVAADS